MNQNFAINLVAEEPVSDVEARVVSCDGGGGALGHPKVYINLVIRKFSKIFLSRKNGLFILHRLACWINVQFFGWPSIAGNL